MKRSRLLIPVLCALLLAIGGTAGATEKIREFDNAAQRERYHALLGQLRCLVCQNQSLESSDADLAEDLRDEVYRLTVVEGRPKEAAIDFLTQRYGDFVLYRPPMRPSTWLLWFGPLLMLAVGAAVAAVIVRQRTRARPLTEAEHAEARRLLDGDNDDDRGTL